MTFRPPLIQRPTSKPPTPGGEQGRVIVNGVDVQFGGPGQWRTYDWPLPKPFPYPKENRTWVQSTDIFLIGKDSQFAGPGQFKSYDWPLPKPFLYPKENRTWLQSTDIFLIGKDVQFGAAGQWRTYDWPLPRPAVYPTPLRTWTWSYNLNLIGKDTFFGGPGVGPRYDWPLPRVTRQGVSWTQNLLETTLSPLLPFPFNQMDWPLPKTPVFPLAQRTHLDWFAVLDMDTFFGEPGQAPVFQWPLPASPLRWLDKQPVQNLLESTLAPVPAVPFVQSAPAVVPFQARIDRSIGGQNLLLTTLADQGAVPVSNISWPLPRVAVGWTIRLDGIPLNPNLFPPPPVTVTFTNLFPIPGRRKGRR